MTSGALTTLGAVFSGEGILAVSFLGCRSIFPTTFGAEIVVIIFSTVFSSTGRISLTGAAGMGSATGP